MRVLIVGKKTIMQWPEQTAKAMAKLTPTETHIYNKRTVGYCLSKLGGKFLRNKYLRYALNRKITRFKPDAVLFVSAFQVSIVLLEAMKRYPHIKAVGWQGDAFDSKSKAKGDCLDMLFCTDTGFIPVAQSFQWRADYVPLCADETLFQPQNHPKTLPPFFVGEANPKRMDYLSACRQRCLIYGKGWDIQKLSQHEVYNEKIAHDKLADCVNKTIVPINLAFSVNNVNGLNFRPFEMGASGCLIMANDCADFSLCFDVGREAVTYRNPAEFADLMDDIVANPDKYARIAKAGYQRVLKEHTFTHRCQTMLDKMATI